MGGGGVRGDKSICATSLDLGDLCVFLCCTYVTFVGANKSA